MCPENDIPDLLACWQHRHDPKFQKQRAARLAELQKQIAPLKTERLAHHALIHRLKFEEVVAASAVPRPIRWGEGRGRGKSGPSTLDSQPSTSADAARSAREEAEAELAELQSRIAPLEKEINQLTRQFWVTKEQVAAQNYDLSASRYRQVEQERSSTRSRPSPSLAWANWNPWLRAKSGRWSKCSLTRVLKGRQNLETIAAMVKTRTVQLGEVCEINPATDFDFAPGDACSFVPMEAVDDVDARIERPKTRPFREVAKCYTPFAENDVIVAKITPCMENGKCAVARNLRKGVGFGSTEFHVLRATRHVIPEWLFYFWRFPVTRKLASVNMTGSAGQKRVPASFLETVQIPLPPLSDQQRIAGQLEQADRLRRTRRYALELSDTFLPAAFLQLFGDPVRYTKGWPVSELEELARVERGKFTPRPRNDPSYYGGRFPFIQTGDITNSAGRLRSWTQTLNEKGTAVSRSFSPGTVVIAIVGATIGMTAILEIEVYCPDSVVGIQVDPAAGSKELHRVLAAFLATGISRASPRNRTGQYQSQTPCVRFGSRCPRFPSSSSLRPWWSEWSACVRSSASPCVRPSTSSLRFCTPPSRPAKTNTLMPREHLAFSLQPCPFPHSPSSSSLRSCWSESSVCVQSSASPCARLSTLSSPCSSKPSAPEHETSRESKV